MILSKLGFAILFTLSTSISANFQTKDYSDSQKLETYLNAIHLIKGFNGELLVANDDKILFQQTVGLTSIENDLKLKKGAKYKIASITKTFTGTLVALATEDHKLSIQDKAIKYIKGLSAKFKDITIAHLLRHTSGLPHYEGIEDYWQIKSKLHMTTEQVIDEINRVNLLFKPGAEMSYSSLGYYLLSTILETVYEDSFQNILQDRILGKLQMTETGTTNTLKIVPQMTSGYHLVSDDSLVVAPYRNYSMLKGSGDMYSTCLDLLKWNNSFLSNVLLSRRAKKSIFRSDKTIKKEEDNYGHGWHIETENPRKYYHGGGTWGYSTYSALYPEEKISIIILSNISTMPITSIASDVEKIVFTLPFQMPSIEKEIPQDSIDLEIYCGNFISDTSKMGLTIAKMDEQLFARLTGRPPFQIYPKGNHRFFGKKVEIAFTFELKENLVTGLKAVRMGQSFHFSKIED